jgi:hypothetical protein
MMKTSTTLGVLLILCELSVATGHGQKKVALSDDKLVAVIKQAAKERIKAEKIEEFVGEKALVNTARDNEWLFLEVVSFVFEGERLRFSEMKEVVYWRRPVNSKYAKLVGLAWTKENHVLFFLAEGRPR